MCNSVVDCRDAFDGEVDGFSPFDQRMAVAEAVIDEHLAVEWDAEDMVTCRDDRYEDLDGCGICGADEDAISEDGECLACGFDPNADE
jgi:hypothetical protein